MLTMVLEDLHDLALPNILNLPLAHSARACAFSILWDNLCIVFLC